MRHDRSPSGRWLRQLSVLALCTSFSLLACGGKRAPDGDAPVSASQQAAASGSLGDARSTQRMLELVKKLSGPEYAGRLPGSEGDATSGAHIEALFREIGLLPGGTEGFHQRFTTAIVEPDGESHGNPRNPQAGQIVRTSNIVGVIPGHDPQLAKEVIIISAHRDHLGVRPDGIYYPGANDDLSGVAAVMELAREFSRRAKSEQANKRTLMFVAYGAEEQHEMGSMHQAAHPLPMAANRNIVMMVSIDMIGVGLDHWQSRSEMELESYAQGWFEQAYDSRTKHSDEVSFQYENQGESTYLTDAGAFAALGIPNRSFGLIDGVASYHQPSDHWASLNYGAAAKLTRAIFGFLWRVDQDPKARATRPAAAGRN